jgi:hypothetical protein
VQVRQRIYEKIVSNYCQFQVTALASGFNAFEAGNWLAKQVLALSADQMMLGLGSAASGPAYALLYVMSPHEFALLPATWIMLS